MNRGELLRGLKAALDSHKADRQRELDELAAMPLEELHTLLHGLADARQDYAIDEHQRGTKVASRAQNAAQAKAGYAQREREQYNAELDDIEASPYGGKEAARQALADRVKLSLRTIENWSRARRKELAQK